MTTPSLTAEQQLAACLANQQNLKNSRLFNIPPFRYTPVSPYNGTVTQFDLDMRRKAEILKYNKNANGKFTQKQLWKQSVNGSLQRRTYSQSSVQNILAGGQCEDLSKLPTPSSSSGVPGPIINLYYDPSINLYNYSTNPNAYATENYEEKDMWLVKYDEDILSLNPIVFILNIRKPIDKTIYNYSFSVPVALYIYGSSFGHIGSPDVSGNFSASVTINSISVNYGGQPIIVNQPTIDYTNLTQTVVGKTNTYNTAGPFNGAIYIGTVSVSNLVLLTNQDNTYDIIFNYTITFNTQTNIDVISASMYTNLGAVFSTSNVFENGLKFTTSPSSVYKPPLIVTGI